MRDPCCTCAWSPVKIIKIDPSCPHHGDEYNAEDDFSRSIDEAYRVIRERKAAGGKGWPE